MKMRKLKILNFGDPLLRQVAKPVIVFHEKLHGLIDAMASTLHRREDGAALAAPQIGILKRIVVIDYQDEYLELINPEIIMAEGKRTEFEGCLSFPGFIGKVTRSDFVKVKYADRYGNEKMIERKGMMAKCIQHEVDHLDGILFIDRMKEGNLIHTGDDTRISLQSALDIADGKLPQTNEI